MFVQEGNKELWEERFESAESASKLQQVDLRMLYMHSDGDRNVGIRNIMVEEQCVDLNEHAEHVEKYLGC